MLKLVLSYVLVLYACFFIKAQEREILQIKGIVTDDVNQPIKGVHCYLKNNDHFGSVTDTLGFFQIAASGSTTYDTLVLSTIGYERKEIPLVLINQGTDTATFQLKQQSIFLEEISVETEGYDLKSLFIRALAQIRKNYPNKKHQLKGLYRSVSTEGKQYTKLEEATITIDDYSYKKSDEYVRMSTQHYRESKDWGNVDTFYVKTMNKVHDKMSERLGNHSNWLFRTYTRGPSARNLESMLEYIDSYRFELMDIEVINGDTIYQIAIRWSPNHPIPRPDGRNYVKINLSDFAIIEEQRTQGFTNIPIFWQRYIRYQKVGDRYYPKMIKETNVRFINQGHEDEEYDIRTIWFDEVRVNKYKKIKFKDAIDLSKGYSYKKDDLDTTFWENTPLIEKYPLNPAVKEDLEKHESLYIQFKSVAKDQK